jgi:rare lipoprotein A
MKKLVMGCAVAGLIVFSAKTEARTSTFLAPLRALESPGEKLATGVAGWYGEEFQGNMTANGEIYDLNGYTAAHLSLPFGTVVRVTNLGNNKQVNLRINDRGPHIARRMLDVTKGAAQRLGFLSAGTALVRMEVVYYPKWLGSPYVATAN